MAQTQGAYYVPHGSHWPIVGSFGLLGTVGGAGMWLNEHSSVGKPVMAVGILLLVIMMFGWFGTVIRESVRGMYNKQVDTSFRMGMMWFIFSEVMFFAAFFGALFYARELVVPWLGGYGKGGLTNYFLWPEFTAAWPTNGPGDVGGAFETMTPWGIPLLNTMLLLTSGVTITIAHHALRAGHRGRLLVFLALTVLLGVVFLGFQIYEYAHAYGHLNLTLGSGIYGSTFFMLTGFHGLHVTLGAIMLAVMWFRCAKGHFTKDNHFGFEAVAWYWHFVDVVWLGLFLFVYVL
ncbi:cytochrome c oxidase subunit 3 [Dokdonella sp.]|uniref:cytochrome c oxidase subunit 3 n=1 Tax=Dokdonella sp. TaxID=2291710 RepID=UPI001B1F4CB4|nr:cytochrome c oxidase subunit 3 [Dokdonella sp.]MBO9661899.1 cytochrome c oxidase subunit 3 [Dokdonella sp.]